MKKKIISIILVFAMLCCMIPATALSVLAEQSENITFGDILGMVTGTYIGKMPIADTDDYGIATVILTEKDICFEVISSADANKTIIDDTGSRAYYTTEFANGRPVYSNPETGSNTFENMFINAKIEFIEKETVDYPAGSYVLGDLFYFYDEMFGKTRKAFIEGAFFDRVELHEHTFSAEWSFDENYHWHESTCEHTGFTSNFGGHSFTEETNEKLTTYTCTVCGYTKTVYEGGSTEGEIISGIVKCDGISLTLDSDIYMNFYMQLDAAALANGKMSFAIGGRTVKDVTAEYNEDKSRYYFACPINALEMNEEVIATFTCGGTTCKQTYSVEDYIEAVVGSGKYGEKAVMLARKIANYGHYAQEYLASIHTNVVIGGENGYAVMNGIFGDENEYDIDADAAKSALESYSLKVTGTTENLSLYGSTVYFDSATALNYYVKATGGVSKAAAVNTETNEVKDVEIKPYKDDISIVSVKGITATEFADDIEVTINEELTITGSVFTYCNSVVTTHSGDTTGKTDADKAKDAKAINAMAAFYEYHIAACEYAKSIKPVYYRVTFYMNAVTKSIDVLVKSGEKVERPDDPITSGYIFDGWYEDDLYEVPWDFDKVITEETMIYAKWAEACTVSFNMMEHGSSVSDQKVKKGGKVTKPNDPTAEGYTFGGWYKDENCTEEWVFATDTVNGDTTLYACWNKITYDAVYVVSLWGITVDGAIFGPATGDTASCLNNTCGSEHCIQNDSWEEIKSNLINSRAYYDKCVINGCTKNIPLILNNNIFSGSTANNPSSVLYSSINGNYLKYNNSYNINDSTSANWATSRIRATLNGYNNIYDPFVPSANYAGMDCLTKDNCLLSCFPMELQNVILPKTYKVATQWSTDSPCQITQNATVTDKLWLPSAIEIYGTAAGDEYSDYGNQYTSKKGISSDKNKAYDESGRETRWWLRSPYRASNYQVASVNYNGSLLNTKINLTSLGLAPCFCIGIE